MPSTFRAALSIIALNLSLITPALAQSNTFASKPVRASAAERETLRGLTEEYGRALVPGDLDAMRKFWHPQSPNLSTSFRYYTGELAQAIIVYIPHDVKM